MSWLRNDFAGLDLALRDQERANLPRRLWFSPGTSREVVFVDDAGVAIEEHNVRFDGETHFLTCRRSAKMDCPLCEVGNRSYLICLFTVLEIQEVPRDDDFIYRHYRAILAAKPYVARLIREEKKRKTGLVGCRYRVATASDHYNQPGQVFKFLSRVNLETYFKPQPFPYERLYKPVSTEKMLQAVKWSRSYREDNDSE